MVAQIPIPNKYFGCGYKGLFFCRNNGWLMKNMDKGLTLPKWVLINQLKIPQIPQNISAQFVCPSPKIWKFNEKMLHLVSVVLVWNDTLSSILFEFPIAIQFYSRNVKNFALLCILLEPYCMFHTHIFLKYWDSHANLPN